MGGMQGLSQPNGENRVKQRVIDGRREEEKEKRRQKG